MCIRDSFNIYFLFGPVLKASASLEGLVREHNITIVAKDVLNGDSEDEDQKSPIRTLQVKIAYAWESTLFKKAEYGYLATLSTQMCCLHIRNSLSKGPYRLSKEAIALQATGWSEQPILINGKPLKEILFFIL